MDEADYAQQNDEFFRQTALREHFAGSRKYLGKGNAEGLHPTGAAPDASPRICEDCGEEIEEARLKAMPFAVRCIDCQTKKERREGR